MLYVAEEDQPVEPYAQKLTHEQEVESIHTTIRERSLSENGSQLNAEQATQKNNGLWNGSFWKKAVSIFSF